MSDRQENRVPKPDDLGSLLETLASLPIEDGEEPQPQEAVARRAARASKSIDEILAEDRARVRRSRYPGRECFEPYEVERYFLGGLEAERAAHTNTCAACSALLHAATPDQAKAERIVEEVREMAEVLSRAPAAEPDTVRESRVRWWRRWPPRPVSEPAYGVVLEFGTLLGFFAATVAVAVAISGVDLRYRLWQPFLEAPEVASVVGGNILQPAIIAFLAAIAVFWLTKRLVSKVGWAVFRQWGFGLPVAFVVLTIVAVGYAQRNLGQRTRQTQLGLRLVSARLTEVVAASVDYRRSAGAFPRVELNAEPVVLTTTLHTPDRAVYRAITDGIKGAMFADVSSDGGAVYWDRGGESKQVASFLVLGKLVLGKIDTMTPDTLVLRERRGTKVTIKAPLDPTRRLGEEVVAIVNQRTNTAIGVYPVESSALRPFQWSRRRDDSTSMQGNLESENRHLALPDQSLPGTDGPFMRSKE